MLLLLSTVLMSSPLHQEGGGLDGVRVREKEGCERRREGGREVRKGTGVGWG